MTHPRSAGFRSCVKTRSTGFQPVRNVAQAGSLCYELALFKHRLSQFLAQNGLKPALPIVSAQQE
jgi:hypothetical protein